MFVYTRKIVNARFSRDVGIINLFFYYEDFPNTNIMVFSL